MNFDKVPELPDVPVKRGSRHARAWLAGGLLLLGGWAAAYWQWGRLPAGRSEAEQAAAGQISRLEMQLEGMRTQLAALPESADPAARRALLEKALAQQNELLRLRSAPVPADTVRLDEWQAELDDTRARESAQRIRELEAAAGELRRRQQTADAVAKLREALRLQQSVNTGLSNRQTKSYGREAQLQQQIEELVAEPLLAESKLALAAARSAAAGGSWADAVAHYGRVREIRRELNRDFPRSRFADLLAEEQLEAELASLGATEAHTQMQAFLAQAAATPDPVAGDRFYALAADRQQVINTEFPKSRFVSMARLEEIEVARQALRLRPVLARVQEFDGRAAEHLRRRELFQAQQLITSALTELEAAIAQSPKAPGLSGELRERVAYLGRRAGEWVTIQDQVYELLLPLATQPPSALLKQAVPQGLYAAVMNANPSRNPGRALPVDSVSRAEAQEFCRRLGWVLGAAVRLPTAAEMRSARPDPTPPAGRGGMGEWLAADATGETDSAPMLGADGVVKAGPPAARAGFRVVVVVDLLGATAR
jgi:hypothetical protein